MKNFSKKIMGLVLLTVLSIQAIGQTIDQERMNRDLKIAEKILGTLAKEEGTSLYSRHRISSSYIPKYGVIFTMPARTYEFAILHDFLSDEDSEITYIKGENSQSAPYVTVKRKGKKGKNSKVKVYTHTDGEWDVEPSDNKEFLDKLKKDKEEKLKKSKEAFRKQATIFLIDYADLIGQLKPTDKIMITTKTKTKSYYNWDDSGKNKTRKASGMTAEISKSYIQAMKKGKASREETESKIVFTTKTHDEKVERDLELFGSIFAKLYDSDISNTYYTSSHRIMYDWLDNFGVIYNMKVYSSSSDNGLHSIRTTGESGLTQEERNTKVNAMYPAFEKSMKENIVDYGRTIKSLKPSEMLMFKVRLTECKGCQMPKSIEMSIKASTLQDFSSGKISREKAIQSISLKKNSY